jgi:hypothetical protein
VVIHRLFLRKARAEQIAPVIREQRGHLNERGQPFSAMSVRSMLM